MFEILVYLYETYYRPDACPDAGTLAKKLSAAGFDDSDISEALTWLAGVARGPHRAVAPLPDTGAAFRAYAPKELAKLDAGCRGLLIYFEQSGILTPQNREHVIERALAANGEGLTLEQLKLVVLMVLWNQQTPSSRLIAEDLLSPITARLPS